MSFLLLAMTLLNNDAKSSFCSTVNSSFFGGCTLVNVFPALICSNNVGPPAAGADGAARDAVDAAGLADTLGGGGTLPIGGGGGIVPTGGGGGMLPIGGGGGTVPNCGGGGTLPIGGGGGGTP